MHTIRVLFQRLLALVLFPLYGCDRVVSSRQIGEPHSITRETTEMRPGFCVTCMPGFDGKMSCGFKFSNFCPFPTTETVSVAPFERTHESGKVDTVEVDQ